jgi:chromosome segregation ATPase
MYVCENFLIWNSSILFHPYSDKKIEIEMQSKQIEDQYKAVSAAFNREKQALGALKDEAIRIAPIQDEEGNDLPLKDQLNDLPDNMTELEESMDDALEKINQIHDNPEVMRIYEEQKRQLQEIKDQLANMSESKELKRQALKDKREPWEASLKNIVEKVNVLFSVYMKELGCAGKKSFAVCDVDIHKYRT